MIAGSVLLLLPFAAQLARLEPSSATFFFIPRESQSARGVEQLARVFSPGRMFPIAMLVRPPPGVSVSSAPIIRACVRQSRQ